MEKSETQKKSTNNVFEVTEKDLADIFEVTGRRIRQMANEGLAIKSRPGRYDLKASMKAYIQKIRRDEQAKNNNIDKIKVAREAEGLKHDRLKKRKTELQVKHLEKQMHLSEDVEYFWNAMVLAAKSKITAIPTKVAPVLVGIEDAKEIRSILKREVGEALNDLANYDIDQFESELDYDEEDQ